MSDFIIITTQTTAYEGFSNIKSITDSDGNKTSYEYDNINRQTKTIDPHGKTLITSYDGLSRIESLQDRNNRIRSFTYDINDNILTESWGSTVKQTYTYDNTSHLKTSYDATSNTTNTYTYNAIYQLTDTTTGNIKFHYEYDIYGDLIQRQDWINSSKIATLDYTFNHNHQLKHISQTGTGVIATEIDFSYNKLSQLQQID